MCNFNNKVIVRLVIQRDDYRVVWIVHVVENATSMLIECAGSYQPGYLRARHSESVPPTTRRFPVNLRAGDVRQGYFDSTSERPELVHAFNFEDSVRAANRYADQVELRALRSGRKYDDPESKGTIMVP